MSAPLRLRDLVPRRADGLPPGQREVRAFPRFSDKPLRWAPKLTPIGLTISVEGTAVATLAAAELPIHLVAAAGDGQAAMFVTDDLLGGDVLLATELDGTPIDRRHGGPLRLVSPGQYGYKNVKHLATAVTRPTTLFSGASCSH